MAIRVTHTSRVGLPPWPRRSHYLGLAVFLTVMAIYGSLVPLQYTPLDLHQAIERFRTMPYLRLGIGSRADWVSNILLFIPISYCWLGTLLLDRRRVGPALWAIPLVIGLSAGLSTALEFTQLWFPPRTVSLNDIVAETIGAGLGAGLWLAIGQSVTDWARSHASAPRPKQYLDWLLEIYCVGLLIYAVLPLDLTISVTELVHKYRQGRIVLMPLADFDGGLEALYGLVRDVLVFVPVGMWVATWRTPPWRPVRSLGRSVLWGGLAVLGIELAQLVVYSRFTSTTDVVTGTCGVWIGAVLMRRWRGREQETSGPPGMAAAGSRTWCWLALAGIYVLVLAVIFCAPFEPLADVRQIKARYLGFFRVPFAALYYGSEFNAVSQVLKKTMLFAPLGSFFALAVRPLRVPRTIRRILLLALWLVASGVALGIELAQVWLPPHVPDFTDVLLCAAGAALGMYVTWRLTVSRAGEERRGV